MNSSIRRAIRAAWCSAGNPGNTNSSMKSNSPRLTRAHAIQRTMTSKIFSFPLSLFSLSPFPYFPFPAGTDMPRNVSPVRNRSCSDRVRWMMCFSLLFFSAKVGPGRENRFHEISGKWESGEGEDRLGWGWLERQAGCVPKLCTDMEGGGGADVGI